MYFHSSNKKQDYFLGLEMEFSLFTEKSWPRKISRVPEDFLPSVHDVEVNEKYAGTVNSQGLHLYWDSTFAEAVSPPVRLDEGFSSRFGKTIDKQLNYFPSREDVEECYLHSIHWNIPGAINSPGEFFTRLSPVFGLFFQTSLTKRTTLKEKGLPVIRGKAPYTHIYELRGDGIANPEQIKGAGLLLGASFQKQDALSEFPYAHTLPTSIGTTRDWHSEGILSNGRDTLIEVWDQRKESIKRLRLQDYLERYYAHIEDEVSNLATPYDKEKLEQMLDGTLPLEWDRKESYQALNEHDERFFTKDLKESPGEPLQRVIPYVSVHENVRSEADLVGDLIDQKGEFIDSIGWNSIKVNRHAGYEMMQSAMDVHNPGSLYDFCEQFTGVLEEEGQGL